MTSQESSCQNGCNLHFSKSKGPLSVLLSWHLSGESACELALPAAHIVFTWFGGAPLSSFLPTLQAVLFQSLGWFFLISLSSKWSCVPGPLLISSGLMALVTIHILILSVGRFISVGLTSFLNSRLLYPAAYSTSPVGWLRSISDLIQPKSNSWKC